MIFVTVGTLFSFERLINAVDDAVGNGLIDEEVFAQIGPCQTKPKHLKYVEMLDKKGYDEMVKNATGLISHAGIGSITLALYHNKPLLVMPRMARYNEHVNDHQVDTARKFEELGHVLVAYEASELVPKIKQIKSFVPKKRQCNPQAVVERISHFLREIEVRP
jgi:UDP-N-acetylglucosamine transferase subunit ALG13